MSNLITLVSKLEPEMSVKPENEFQALHYFENLIITQSKVIPTASGVLQGNEIMAQNYIKIFIHSLISEGDEFEDITDMHLTAHIPTREEIKKQSAIIVKENSVGDEFVPIAAPRRKKIKF